MQPLAVGPDSEALAGQGHSDLRIIADLGEVFEIRVWSLPSAWIELRTVLSVLHSCWIVHRIINIREWSYTMRTEIINAYDYKIIYIWMLIIWLVVPVQ